jgi:hypothetical protein
VWKPDGITMRSVTPTPAARLTAFAAITTPTKVNVSDAFQASLKALFQGLRVLTHPPAASPSLSS